MSKPRKPRGRRQAQRSKFKNDEKFFTKEDIFLSRMASILLVDKKLVKSFFSQRNVSTIRLNNLLEDPQKIKQHLIDAGLDLIEVDWSPNTYIVSNMDKSELGRMQEYDRGLFYIQNLSSMLPVIVLDPQPGEKILDMTAAPGSKTSMIAALTGNEVEMIANEEDHRRAGKLRAVLSQFGVKHTQVTEKDARFIGKALPDHFDKVLLDAPCSGEGLVYLRGDKPLRFWNIKKIKHMSSLQKQLITSAFDTLKPGGELIYSTCTLEPEENEGVVTHLVEQRKNARIEKIDLVNSDSFKEFSRFTTRGIVKWSGNRFHQESARAIRVIPSAQMQGFFVSKISKKK